MDNEVKKSLSDEAYLQVSSSIKSIFELTTRIDERVQHIVKKQDDLDKKIENQISYTSSLSARLAVVESNTKNESINDAISALEEQFSQIKDNYHILNLKMQEVQGDASRSEGRWKNTFGFALQIVWTVVAAYVLYKLGLQSPP